MALLHSVKTCLFHSHKFLSCLRKSESARRSHASDLWSWDLSFGIFTFIPTNFTWVVISKKNNISQSSTYSSRWWTVQGTLDPNPRVVQVREKILLWVPSLLPKLLTERKNAPCKSSELSFIQDLTKDFSMGNSFSVSLRVLHQIGRGEAGTYIWGFSLRNISCQAYILEM